TVAVDIGTLLGLSSASGAAWVGVTGATGLIVDQHDITGWKYCADPLSPLSVPATTTPVSSLQTPGQNAVWTVPIHNAGAGVLQGVTATLHATANGSTPLTFVSAVMPGCAAAAGNSEVCSLPDIAANSTQSFKVFVATTGLTAGATITGDISV